MLSLLFVTAAHMVRIDRQLVDVAVDAGGSVGENAAVLRREGLTSATECATKENGACGGVLHHGGKKDKCCPQGQSCQGKALWGRLYKKCYPNGVCPNKAGDRCGGDGWEEELCCPPQHACKANGGGKATCVFDADIAEDTLTFPHDFFFGLASAPAHVEDQLDDAWLKYAHEGGVHAWKNAPAAEERLKFWTDPDVELDLVQETHSSIFRFGVDWGRLFPDGYHLDEAAMEQYAKIVQNVKDRGLKVMLTLFHHSAPKWTMPEGSLDQMPAVGDEVQVTNDEGFLEFEMRGSQPDLVWEDPADSADADGWFMSWWNGVEENWRHPLAGKAGKRGKVVETDVGMAKLDSGIGWIPLRGLVGFEGAPIARLEGWPSKTLVPFFAHFADTVAARLGHNVDYWTTFNEPHVFVAFTYCVGMWPPGPEITSAIKQVKCLAPGGDFSKAMANMATAHNEFAVRCQKAGTCKDAQMGVANNVGYEVPHKWWDKPAVKAIQATTKFVFQDAVNDHCDFVGVNYYGREIISGTAPVITEEWEYSESGRAVDPQGLYHTIVAFSERYGKKILITENGISDATDTLRPAYLLEHLAAIHQAIADGAQVGGYIFWTLSDNWEWKDGYCPKFGMVAVDRANGLARTKRPSFDLFTTVAQTKVVTQAQRDAAWKQVADAQAAGMMRPFCRAADGKSSLDDPVDRKIATRDWRFDPDNIWSDNDPDN